MAGSSGSPSHWATLDTVKRFRNGIACGSSPCSRAGAFVVGNEPVGEHHSRAALAFADVAAHVQRLARGQPVLAWEAVLNDGIP